MKDTVSGRTFRGCSYDPPGLRGREAVAVLKSPLFAESPNCYAAEGAFWERSGRLRLRAIFKNETHIGILYLHFLLIQHRRFLSNYHEDPKQTNAGAGKRERQVSSLQPDTVLSSHHPDAWIHTCRALSFQPVCGDTCCPHSPSAGPSGSPTSS